MLRGGNLKVVRDNIDSVKDDSLFLHSGDVLQADYIVSCTGWGDHFGMFDADTKTELGLPSFEDTPLGRRSKKDIAWDKHDAAATKTVDERLPFLTQGPELKNPKTNDASAQRRWRLYKRSVPLNLALKDDRSLVILGQIHTIQTPMVSEIQSFWSILYLLGELDLPDEATMTREIAEWNVWTRKRYISQGQKFPYCIFDFLPVCLIPSSPFSYILLFSVVVNFFSLTHASLYHTVSRRPLQRRRHQLPPQEQLRLGTPLPVSPRGLLRLRRRVPGQAAAEEEVGR